MCTYIISIYQSIFRSLSLSLYIYIYILSVLTFVDLHFWEVPSGDDNSTPLDRDSASVKPREIQNLSTEIGRHIHAGNLKSQK